MRMRIGEDDKGGCKGEGRQHAKMVVMRDEGEGGEGNKGETEKEDESDEGDRKDSALANNRDNTHRAPPYEESKRGRLERA
jgi:hypothetical protein